MIDRADVLVAVGTAILGYAVWSVFGTPGVLAYVGAILIALGILAAWRQGRKGKSVSRETDG